MRLTPKSSQATVPSRFLKDSLLWIIAVLASLLDIHAQEPASIVISEFLAANRANMTDDDGESSDWIELWNPNRAAVDIEDLFLTDDSEAPTQWAIPRMSIPANGYLLIFASGKDRNRTNAPLHTNFRLSRQAGSFLALTQKTASGVKVLTEFSDYPAQRTDISYGFAGGDSTTPIYFNNPTPSERNSTNTVRGFVADTRFSIDRGFYDRPILVTLSSSTPGATLVHTTDGSLPSPRNGHQTVARNAETPPAVIIPIDTTTTLRAMAFLDGHEPTNIDTQTYIFPSRVLQQDNAFHAIGNSQRWGHAGPDWEMDPTIINHNNPEIRPEPEDLLRLATVSLSFNFDEFFGRRGIYIAGQSVEKTTSIEFLDPSLNGNQEIQSIRGFQTDGTVQIVGGSSPNRWKSDKLSLRLKFDNDLGYSVFGRDAVDRFDTLVLDARLNNVWHYGGGVEPTGQRNRAQYIRDQYTANLHNQLGGHSPHGRHVHLYLNGIYWGIHTLHERPDDNFAASYLGGDNSDYDSIKHRPGDVLQGTSENYNRLHALVDQQAATNVGYDSIAQRLDVQDFTAYMLVNYYVGNTDWAHHNWYASYNRVDPEGRWRFHSWDAEKGLHHVNDDRTGRNDNGAPTNLHRDLIRNEEYRLQFADRAYDALLYGPLSPTAAKASYAELSDLIDLPIRVESARWGDNQRSQPYNRLDWLETRNQLYGTSTRTSSPLYDYFARRNLIVLEQFRKQNWLPSLSPPTFNQHGGAVPVGFQAAIQGARGATIYYTTDGSNPRIPGVSGEQSTTELVPATAQKFAIMPEDGSLESSWSTLTFDATDWPKGRRGAGYENGNGYQSLIDPNFDFKSQVSRTANESIYMRVPFQLTTPSDFDQLTLLMRYDDGFIAYLNGEEVARANSPGTQGRPQAWDAGARTTHSDGNAVQFLAFDITSALNHLQPGDNLLAVHGLNSGPSSSDFLIWPSLIGSKSEGGTPSGIAPTASVYQSPIPISQPTQVKARIRQGQEWSPLLSAVFLPNRQQPTAENLTLTTIHYRPAAPSPSERDSGFSRRREFEFLELTNLSQETVHLTGSKFAAGIRFEFKNELSFLEPGKSLIIAANPPAFRTRYTTENPVLGPFLYESQLANDGEAIRLINPDDEVVFSVNYQDGSPWPQLADGAGYALSLRDPRPNLDLNTPEVWIATQVDNLNSPAPPGSDDQPFNAWLATHFTTAERQSPTLAALEADPDLDGIDNRHEFFHGTNPRAANSSDRQIKLVKSKNSSENIPYLEFTHSPSVPSQWWALESSDDLADWTPIQLPQATDARTNPDQSLTIRIPIRFLNQQRFYRLNIAPPPTQE